MRFVSTRGSAPALSFSDAILAGLARDGGLYLPQSWPQISAAAIEGMGGDYLPTAEAIISPFLADDHEAPSADIFAKMPSDAYATFRHPSVTPLVEIAPNRYLLELFHGPTLAFKDVAMQFLARMMDHILSGSRPARHHRRRHFGRHRLCGDRGIPRPRHDRHLHPPSRGPHLRGAAPADDPGARCQCPQPRHPRHLRRLPDYCEGTVQPISPFCDKA